MTTTPAMMNYGSTVPRATSYVPVWPAKLQQHPSSMNCTTHPERVALTSPFCCLVDFLPYLSVWGRLFVWFNFRLLWRGEALFGWGSPFPDLARSLHRKCSHRAMTMVSFSGCSRSRGVRPCRYVFSAAVFSNLCNSFKTLIFFKIVMGLQKKKKK